MSEVAALDAPECAPRAPPPATLVELLAALRKQEDPEANAQGLGVAEALVRVRGLGVRGLGLKHTEGCFVSEVHCPLFIDFCVCVRVSVSAQVRADTPGLSEAAPALAAALLRVPVTPWDEAASALARARALAATVAAAPLPAVEELLGSFWSRNLDVSQRIEARGCACESRCDVSCCAGSNAYGRM